MSLGILSGRHNMSTPKSWLCHFSCVRGQTISLQQLSQSLMSPKKSQALRPIFTTGLLLAVLTVAMSQYVPLFAVVHKGISRILPSDAPS